MRRELTHWVLDHPHLARQLWFPPQNLDPRFYHPQRTTANTRLALSTSAVTAASYRGRGQGGAGALLPLGSTLGTKTSGICGS